MTHIDDLWTPDDDREPEPPDDDPALTLDEISAFLAAAHGSPMPAEFSRNGTVVDADAARQILLDLAVGQLLTEVRERRADAVRWQNMRATGQYMVTVDGQAPPASSLPVLPLTREQADEMAAAHAGCCPSLAVWAKHTYVTGWEPHEVAPF